MSNIVLVGAQWGDEGKGKVIDILAEDADILIRYQGGNNAGHTVIVEDQQFIFHLLPSGLLHPGKIGLIGNGVVIDPEALGKELAFTNNDVLKAWCSRKDRLPHSAQAVKPEGDIA